MHITEELIGRRYRLSQKIGEGGISEVYLAIDTADGGKRAIKFLKPSVTSSRVEDLIRFHSESATISQLSHPNIVRIFDVGEFKSVPFLVMEFLDGPSLKDHLSRSARVPISEAIDIILQLCGALEYIHAARIVHRDLKPGNIMLAASPAGKRVLKLIDFGFAQLKDFLGNGDSLEVVGTFGYMSPEQCGVVRRKVDSRSDLYSLGVICYQLFTGLLPFEGNTVSALIHQHIARIPEHPSRIIHDLPVTLGDIAMKLLEKEPEKRYQSAAGLTSDLKKFRRGKRNFALGLDEQITALNYRTNLVGREKEFSYLSRLYRNASQGEGSICLVSGEAGRGKTRLVEELRDLTLATGGLFIDGKCFSGENKTPYGPFRDALGVFVQNYLHFTEARKSETRTAILDLVGELGEIAVRVNPAMSEILGPVPPLVELESDRENERFLITASRFLLGLGSFDHPLVIALDDLQWSDQGTLDLLSEIARNIAHAHVLIMGTYRDNEVGDLHPLGVFKRQITEGGYKLQEIHVDLFDAERQSEFVARLLFAPVEEVREISDFIHRKSKGNPFFTIEIIKQIINDEALVRKQNRWALVSEVLEKTEIAGSIIDIIIKRISLLDRLDVEVLSYAAVIGRKFTIELLFALVSRIPRESIVAIVDRSIDLQLLERDLQEKGKILFVHDRIREAFYRNIGGDRIRILHLEIARALEKLFGSAGESALFDLAYHYIHAGDEENALRCALPAGLKAMDHYANEDAIRYFEIARGLIEKEKGIGGPEWLLCIEKTGEINLRIGRNDEGISLFNKILPFVKDNRRKANLYMQLCIAFFKKGDWKMCEANAKVGLALLGESLPTSGPAFALSILREALVHLLHNFIPALGSRAPRKESRPEQSMIVWFYLRLCYAYLLGNGLKYFLRSTLRMLNICESKIGPSRDLGMAMAGYASLCMAIPLFRRAEKFHDRALALREELGDDWGVAQSLQFIGFCHQWAGNARKGLEFNQKSFARFQRIGDIWEMAMCNNGFSAGYFYLAEYEKSIQASMRWLEISKRINDTFGESTSMANLAWAHTEMGNYDEARRWGRKGLDLSIANNHGFEICLNSTYYGYLEYMTGNHADAIRHLEKARDLDLSTDFLKAYTSCLYYYLADAYRQEYLDGKGAFSRKESRALLRKIEKASSMAIRKTKAWKHNYGCALRSKAQYYALTGQSRNAERFFLQSIRLLDETGRRFELARTFLEYGEFLAAGGKPEIAYGKWTTAYRIFSEINAKVFAQKAAELLGIHGPSLSPRERMMDRRRFLSIIEVSQDVSSVLNINELLDLILSKAVEVTGAQRGYLFLPGSESGELEISATRNIQETGVDTHSHSIVTDVFRQDKTVITTNAEKDEALSGYISVATHSLKSILAVPIRHHEKVLGVCYLDNPLSSGVFTEEDADLLRVFMSQAAIAIENAQLYQGLEKKVDERTRELTAAYRKLDRAYSTIKDDLAHAKIIHESIFPKNLDAIENLRFCIDYRPAIDVGGDLYDITPMHDGTVRVFLADAIGHGVQAALATMLIKSEYEKIKRLDLMPHQIIELMNESFNQIYRTTVSFFTCAILNIDTDRGKLRFASAGHPEQYLLRGSQIIEMRSPGRAVGLHSEIKCETVELDIAPDDRFLLFTDGLTEQFRSSGELYGEQRLQAVVRGAASGTIGEIISAITKDIIGFIGRSEVNDDMTIIGIEQKQR